MAKERSAVIAGFTEDQAHRLTSVSLRQLRYWAKDGFFVPSLDMTAAGFPKLRLYSFRDLVCLRVVSSLRNDSKVPLQQLRQLKTKLAHLGEDLWAKTTLYVLDRRVVLSNPETGELEDALTGQGVLRIPLLAVSNDMHAAIRALRTRPAETHGRIDVGRGGARNPVVAGTRVPVRAIQDLAQEGFTAAEIVAQYPSLTEADVAAALGHRIAA
jgi:DNA-binding transcriptional MerR regulator